MLLRRLSALAVLTIALGSAGAAYAFPDSSPNAIVAQREGRSGRGGGGKFGGIEQLNLTPEQRQEIENIRNQYQGQTENLRQEMRQAKDQLQQLMSGNASDGELRSQHSQLSNLHQEMAEIRFNQMLEIRGVLTPEQREQWAEQMQEHRQGGRDRFGNGRGNRNSQ